MILKGVKEFFVEKERSRIHSGRIYQFSRKWHMAYGNQYFNWYGKILIAGLNPQIDGNQFQLYPDYGGDFFVTHNNGQKIYEILKSVGFRWNGVKGPGTMWWADASRLMGTPGAIATLQELGIDTGGLTNPATPARRPQAPASIEYILGESINIPNLEKDSPIAVYQRGSRWVWISEDGRSESIPLNNPANYYMKSVKDAQGGLVISNNAEELFEIYNSFYKRYPSSSIPKLDEAVENEPVIEDTDVMSGNADDLRIPAEMLSPYQKQIQDAFQRDDSNIVINALAGTGKTSVLKHIASFKNPGEKWLYLVFNKKNQVEAEEDFNKIGVDVLTSHSFLGKMLKTVPHEDFPIGQLSTEQDRTGQMVKDALELSDLIPRNFRVDTRKFPNGRVYYNAKISLLNIIDKCKANAVDPRDRRSLPQAIGAVIDQYDIETDIQSKDRKGNPTGPPIEARDALIAEAATLLNELLPGADLSRFQRVPKETGNGFWNNERNYRGVYNHDDTLWYSALNGSNIQWDYYPVVLVDEVQDFNKCQQTMLQNLIANGSRVVAVGDPYQSIYMFRGADSDSFNRVQEIVGGGNEAFVLPVNYRCGKKIIDFVNGHPNSPVRDLQAGLSHDGEVMLDEDHYGCIQDVIAEYHQNGGKLSTPTAFIARTNNILQEAALMFISEDVEFEFIGFNMSRQLLDLCDQIVGKGRMRKNMPMKAFEAQLEQKNSTLLGIFDRLFGNEKRKAEDQKRIHEAVSHILSGLIEYDNQGGVRYFDKVGKREIKTSNDFINFIKRKFKGLNFDSESTAEIERIKEFQNRDTHEYVALCSAHRSKGLEFERVYVLGQDQFPSKRANTEKEIGQEKNAWYVALTRAKNELHVPQPPPRD